MIILSGKIGVKKPGLKLPRADVQRSKFNLEVQTCSYFAQ
jgi:hypothetical protein